MKDAKNVIGRGHVKITLKEVALKYWKQGLVVIPAKAKKPLVEWSQWQKKKQTQQDFSNLPWDEADVFGILLGQKLKKQKEDDPDLFLGVIDFDVKNLAEDIVEKGRKTLKNLPITQIEETPSGGQHWVYFSKEKPQTISVYHNNAALELLGEKKLAYMAPSEGYKRLNDNTPTTVSDLTELFRGILESIGVKFQKADITKTNVCFIDQAYRGPNPPCVNKLLRGTKEGLRNEHGIRLASYLLNFRGYQVSNSERVMKKWNNYNDPPLSRTELDIILRSAAHGSYVYGCDDSVLKEFCKKEGCPLASIKVEITKKQKEKAEKILEDPKILKHVLDWGRKRLIGEDDVLLINFIEICSGQTKYPISGMLEGFSGSGKNESIRAVKQLFPLEMFYEFTTSTPEAIKYIPEEFSGTLLIYEASGIKSKTGTLGLRAVGEGQSIETIYPVRDERTGKMKLERAKTNARNFITTESEVDVLPDLYRRVFRVSMNHSDMLTKRVMAKKLRDSEHPEGLKKVLGVKKNPFPFELEDFQNALRIQDWNLEVLMFPPDDLMDLMDVAVTKEQRVALRTHIERILSFGSVLALLHQKKRLRIKIKDYRCVVVNPEDFFVALKILGQTLLETITRVGKRSAEVLELAEKYGTLNKHRVSAELNISDSTAYKCLKSLAELAFLKEDRTAKPFNYEMVKKRCKQLGVLENPSGYFSYFEKRLKTLLNSISPTLLRGIPPEKIELEGLEYALNKKNRHTSARRVGEVGFEYNPSFSLENKLKPLGISETPSQNGVEPSLLKVENLLLRKNKIIQNLKQLTRLTTDFEDKCAICHFEGRMDWQVTLHDGTWGLLCDKCGLIVEKKLGAVE